MGEVVDLRFILAGAKHDRDQQPLNTGGLSRWRETIRRAAWNRPAGGHGFNPAGRGNTNAPSWCLTPFAIPRSHPLARKHAADSAVRMRRRFIRWRETRTG